MSDELSRLTISSRLTSFDNSLRMSENTLKSEYLAGHSNNDLEYLFFIYITYYDIAIVYPFREIFILAIILNIFLSILANRNCLLLLLFNSMLQPSRHTIYFISTFFIYFSKNLVCDNIPRKIFITECFCVFTILLN